MAGTRFSSATVYLKVAVGVLIIVFIVHVVGFAIPRWSIFKAEHNMNVDGIEDTYHVGLWQNCSCGSALGSSKCDCDTTKTFADSLKIVQILETMGLIGLLVSVITSLVLLCAKEDAIKLEKVLKILNTAIVVASGVVIVIGAAVFAVESSNDYKGLFGYVSNETSFWDSNYKYVRLGEGFLSCTIAGGLSLIVCTFLLVLDYRTAAKQAQTMAVLFPHQDQFTVHKQVIMNTLGPRQPDDFRSIHTWNGLTDEYNHSEQTLFNL